MSGQDGRYLQAATSQIPLPSPTPSKLPTEINNSTRSLHTELNALITSRLPLALPPNTDDSTLYAIGISVFAQIYLVLEEQYSLLISATISSSGTTEIPSDIRERNRVAIRTCLSTLIPPGLWRRDRLEADLRVLQARTAVDLEKYHAQCRPLLDLTERLRELASARPHVLIAYTWIMYMAIFSGGRWMRQRLRDAGPEFWSGRGLKEEDDSSHYAATVATSLKGQELYQSSGYSVFEFDGERDGEDVKADFKTRLDAVEQPFTEQQRADVVEESKRLFKSCIDIVYYLDGMTLDMSRAAGSRREAAFGRTRRRGLESRSESTFSLPSALLAIFVGCASLYCFRFLGLL